MAPKQDLIIEQIGSAVLFAESVEPLLIADPVRNTHAVGWLDSTLQAEQAVAAEANARMFGASSVDLEPQTQWPPIMQVVRQRDTVIAAAIQGRRSGLTSILAPNLASETAAHAMFLVGSELASVGPHITSLTGPTAAVESMNAGLAAAGGAHFHITLRTTLQELGQLQMPDPTPGWSRPPDPQDEAEMAMLARWQQNFSRDVGVGDQPALNSGQQAGESRRRSRVLFWCNQSGPVAMAAYGTDGAGAILRGCARISQVYSPDEHRGHGFGKAVTHAVCADARRRGARRLLLFADIKAGAANRICQQLGFRPVTEFTFMNRIS